jgi:predicted esterase
VIEHHITIPRTARYYTIGDSSADEVWFVCHGYAQLARYFIRSFEALNDGTRLIVASEALNRYYFETAPGAHAADARVAATWMTREDREHEIADYIGYLDRLYAHIVGNARRHVIALGFSQGSATVSRWAAHGQSLIDHVVLWAGTLAAELVPAPALFHGAALTLAVGSDDEHVTPQRVHDEQQRLRAGALNHTLVRYDGGHRIEMQALRRLAGDLRRNNTEETA